MKDLQLTIGHNVDGTPAHTTRTVCAAVASVLGIEAFTAIQCLGMWHGEAEASTRVEICALTDAEAVRISSLIPQLAANLGQLEIMTEIRDSRVHFVEARESSEKTA